MIWKSITYQVSSIKYAYNASRAFTLIETLVAISLLTIAVVAPMSLTTQSLASAYYGRDQVTAFYLAQEAIEGVRSVRDNNILATVLGTQTDLMADIPSSTGAPFTIDTVHLSSNKPTLTACPGGTPQDCPFLQTDGELYGYQTGWNDTNFKRYITANYVNGNTDEVKISVTMEWQTAAFQTRSFTLSENMYRWIDDGTGSVGGGGAGGGGGGGGGGAIVCNPEGSGSGLIAQYFSRPDFTNLEFSQTDPVINFNWGFGSPDPSIPNDQFSVRWQGKVLSQCNQTYTFITTSDDGVRLWINNQLIVDNWTDHNPTENSGSITLDRGVKYDIRMDYYENTGGTLAKLEWFGPSTTRAIIPATQLSDN